MPFYKSFRDYLYNLHASNSGEARRMWKASIKEKWNHECAYCGSDKEITIDHIVPQALGGIDFSPNVVACCRSCNHDKGHEDWKQWYKKQTFFDPKRMHAIIEWMKPHKEKNSLHRYRPRKTKVY